MLSAVPPVMTQAQNALRIDRRVYGLPPHQIVYRLVLRSYAAKTVRSDCTR